MARALSASAIIGIISIVLAIVFRSEPTIPPKTTDWNLFYHLGGYGPYVTKIAGTVQNDTLPDGCQVEQVHMLARHAERYPTLHAGTRMLDLYHRIDQAGIKLNGTLEFVNTWSFLTGQPNDDFDHLTKTSQYAGIKTAFDLGVRLRTTYFDLHRSLVGKHTSFWASDSQRVIETAQYFATAFFGLYWPHVSTLHIISEAKDLGANTLTPGETCANYESEDNELGWNLGATRWNEFRQTYLSAVQQRFLQENPGFEFTFDEIYVMQEMCGFEVMAKGSSPWCNVFTHDEWESYEYARDVLHYYRSGPGNPYAAAMGWIWLNATVSLLRDEEPFFFSFAHDGDIFPMLAALDLFPQPVHLPTSHIARDRTWRTSDTVPMGANIIFEKLSCPIAQECWSSSPMYPNHVYCAPPQNETLIRIKVNDGVVALPGCDSGAGQTCPLQNFTDRIAERGKELEDFATICGLSEDAPKQIDFLHQ